jgi:hypothetical protein
VTKIAQAFDDVQNAELELADALRTLGERHVSDVDVYHVAHLLGSRCGHQMELLAPHAERYEAHGPADTETRKSISEPAPPSRDEAPGILLLSDLQRLYGLAHRAELAWVVLLQVGQATRDERLVSAASEGREEAERRWKWLRTKIKESSPQALLAG